jgi:hypothetical protein
MRKLTHALIITLTFLLGITQTTFASGLKLVKNGDTYYLSTDSETSTTATTTSKVVVVNSATDSATGSSVFGTPIEAPQGYTTDFGAFINFALQLIITIALLLVLFNLIMAGFQWITSGGDKGKVDAARQRIVAALVGILILSAAYALAQLVAYLLGFDSFNDIFSTVKRINP